MVAALWSLTHKARIPATGTIQLRPNFPMAVTIARMEKGSVQSARPLVRSAPVRLRATNLAGVPRRMLATRVATPVSSSLATEERAKLSAERAGALLEGEVCVCSSAVVR